MSFRQCISNSLINLTVNMNQRSVSVNRKLKTDLHDEIPFERRVAKAILHKKQTISKMFTPRQHCLPSFRSTQNHTQNSNRNSHATHKPSKEIRLSQQTITSYLQNHNKGREYCVIHPAKFGAFEDKEKRADTYCHECAIKMVKNNYKMAGITWQSTLLKCFLEGQLHLVRQEEQKVEETVRQYYNQVRAKLEHFYKQFIQSKSSMAALAEFEPSSALSRMTEHLGRLQGVKFRFMQQNEREDKDNKENLAKQVNRVRNSIQRKDEKGRKAPLEVRVELNRSFQANATNSNLSELFRSRDNSFCGKAEHPRAEHPKAEHPKAEHPRAEHPRAEHPRAEHPKAEHPKKHANLR